MLIVLYSRRDIDCNFQQHFRRLRHYLVNKRFIKAHHASVALHYTQPECEGVLDGVFVLCIVCVTALVLHRQQKLNVQEIHFCRNRKHFSGLELICAIFQNTYALTGIA